MPPLDWHSRDIWASDWQGRGGPPSPWGTNLKSALADYLDGSKELNSRFNAEVYPERLHSAYMPMHARYVPLDDAMRIIPEGIEEHGLQLPGQVYRGMDLPQSFLDMVSRPGYRFSYPSVMSATSLVDNATRYALYRNEAADPNSPHTLLRMTPGPHKGLPIDPPEDVKDRWAGWGPEDNAWRGYPEEGRKVVNDEIIFKPSSQWRTTAYKPGSLHEVDIHGIEPDPRVRPLGYAEYTQKLPEAAPTQFLSERLPPIPTPPLSLSPRFTMGNALKGLANPETAGIVGADLASRYLASLVSPKGSPNVWGGEKLWNDYVKPSLDPWVDSWYAPKGQHETPGPFGLPIEQYPGGA